MRNATSRYPPDASLPPVVMVTAALTAWDAEADLVPSDVDRHAMTSAAMEP